MRYLEETTLALAALAAILGGCAGDPDLDRPDVDVELESSVERDLWEDAEPGCEDVSSERDLKLVACEGEPLLGALVDEHGRVECVDALHLLLSETRPEEIEPTALDPSPQPSHPGRPEGDLAYVFDDRSSGEGSGGHGMSGGMLTDPTPTPVTQPLREDPTPTPVTQPDQEDPTPTPVMD